MATGMVLTQYITDSNSQIKTSLHAKNSDPPVRRASHKHGLQLRTVYSTSGTLFENESAVPNISALN
jgi:hypothetical protein